MTRDEKHERGVRAARLLEDPDILAAFALIKLELFTEWGNADTEQKRESLHASHRALDRLAAMLDRWRVDAAVIQKENK